MGENVREYYNANVLREWGRLDSGYRNIEFLTTLNAIDRYFPTGKVCDIGCGPGKYSIELLKKGFQVTLFDLSQEELNYAKAEIQNSGLIADDYVCGNAVDLSVFGDESFDAVLLMGPMYHLIKSDDRRQCLKEVKRILKSDGIALIAYINSWGVVRALIEEELDFFANLEEVERMLNGTGYSADENWTELYLSNPKLMKEELGRAGFKIANYYGSESFVAGMNGKINEIKDTSPDIYEKIKEMAIKLCDHEQYRDITEHIHFIVKK